MGKHEKHTVPDKEAIAAMEAFDRLELNQIKLVSTGAEAEQAWQALQGEKVLGFDTESKPTFRRDEVSDGPHIVQLSTAHTGYVFQLHDAACRAAPCGRPRRHSPRPWRWRDAPSPSG